ncbi:MAG: DUF4445 domain-containing protein [Deltaproteobacteria bacterium]|nr:DUF4445 domain-containing protein [Deltaproteobacteria bacterium]
MSTVHITFLPDAVELDAARGESLLQAALDAGVYIDAACGGTGSCGRCRLILREGEIESDDLSTLSVEQRESGVILACQCRATGSVVVQLVEAARVEGSMLGEGEALSTRKLRSIQDLEVESGRWRFDPPVDKLALHLDPPSLQDNTSDLSRLYRAIRQQHAYHHVTADSAILPTLSQRLREGDWNVTATVADARLEWQMVCSQDSERRSARVVRVEPGDTTREHVVLAVDIGTTTVWAQLLDLERREVLATASDYNAQISFGEDVVTRILASNKEGGLSRLQSAVVQTINGLIERLLLQTDLSRADILQVTAAGNTIMTHLVLGIPPRTVREAPYVPTMTFAPPVRALDIGLKLPEHVFLYTIPSVAGFMGGDIVAGVIAAGFHRDPEVTLYIDLGTNGEIVLGNEDWLVSASCSAGPAFEGGGIRCGVRAMPGAVVEFRIDPDTYRHMIVTMGQKQPIGVCGVGLIGMIAEMYNKGVLEPNGRFRTDLPTKRIRPRAGEYEYVVVDAANSGTGADIVLTEADIENILRAKAAIYAGVMTLLESVNLAVDDISRVIISGGLGNFLELENSIQIGLFPDLPRERFRYVGNGSLIGARLVTMSREMLESAEQVAHRITNVELMENRMFMDHYASAKFIPHTDQRRFPSVRRWSSQSAPRLEMTG